MPELSELAALFGLLLLVGAFAGMIAGLLGVGGGIVLVPAFFYIFQSLDYGGDRLMQVCLGTSLATIVVTSIRSVLAHHRKGAVDWALIRQWGPWIGMGAFAGFVFAAGLKSQALQILFSGLALIAGLYMAFGRAEWRLGVSMPGGTGKVALGSGLGFFSSLMGIGGGTFGVPMMSLFSVPIHRAIATAAGIGLIIAVPATLGYLFLTVTDAPPFSIGAVNLPAFFTVIAMTLITTPFGAGLAHRTNPDRLRRIFAVFVILVALNMARKVLFG